MHSVTLSWNHLSHCLSMPGDQQAPWMLGPHFLRATASAPKSVFRTVFIIDLLNEHSKQEMKRTWTKSQWGANDHLEMKWRELSGISPRALISMQESCNVSFTMNLEVGYNQWGCCQAEINMSGEA